MTADTMPMPQAGEMPSREGDFTIEGHGFEPIPESARYGSLTAPTRESGARVVMARATSRSGETQVNELIHNPAGYHHNVIQRVYVEVV